MYVYLTFMFCNASSYVFLVPNTDSSEETIQPVVLPHIPNHIVSENSKFLINLHYYDEIVAHICIFYIIIVFCCYVLNLNYISYSYSYSFIIL